MDSLALLSEYVETAKTNDSFAVEKQMTGAVLVRNVPIGNSARLIEMISDDLKIENIKALRLLASKNITSKDDVYTLEGQTADSDKTLNARFTLKYTGPRLKDKISGIHNTKEAAAALLHTIVTKNVTQIRLEKFHASKMSRNKKPVDVSIVFKYGTIRGRYLDARMAFIIVPNKPVYGEMVKTIMPKMLENMVISPAGYDPKSGQSKWNINAAGKPWLVRIAFYLEKHMKR